MNIFIDCEWNSFGGALISMALCAESGEEFYEALWCPEPDPWVQENVMPILNKPPVQYELFQLKLSKFLNQFARIHIVADWAEDIKHFCDALITGPGMCMNTPPLTMEVLRIDAQSKLPHNALEDARAIREAVLMMKS